MLPPFRLRASGATASAPESPEATTYRKRTIRSRDDAYTAVRSAPPTASVSRGEPVTATGSLNCTSISTVSPRTKTEPSRGEDASVTPVTVGAAVSTRSASTRCPAAFAIAWPPRPSRASILSRSLMAPPFSDSAPAAMPMPSPSRSPSCTR